MASIEAILMSVQPKSLSLVNRLFDALDKRGLTRTRIIDFSALLSGQVGRLVFSMIYFIVLARALSLGEFGIFATCSAIGIVISRLLGFGFISPLFRVATTRPRLIGAYTSGFLIAAVFSIPILAVIAWGIHWLLYANILSLLPFMYIIAAEVICWRGIEMVIIVCNGQNRYTTGSFLGIFAVAIKAIAATIFFLSNHGALDDWAKIYFFSLLVVMILSLIGFYPKQRLRWKPRAWLGRMRDAVGVSAAETLFYIQSELDKVLVLALGGEMLAGLYAIAMRLIDLTAIPLRALSTMLTQWIMRERQSGRPARTGLKLDLAIGGVSLAAMLALAFLLSLVPNIIGENIALGVSYLWLLVLVPAFRNAIELHTELLYGHERVGARVALLTYLGVMKAALISVLLSQTSQFDQVAIWLNLVFGILYIASALVTYGSVLNKSGQSTKLLMPQ